MNNNLLNEAFQALKLLNEEDLDITSSSKDELKDFLDNKNEEPKEVDVIDLDAEENEDVEQDNIGKIILQCPCCQTVVMKKASEVGLPELEESKGDEDKLVDVGEQCPVCFSEEGYKIVGKVAPLEEVTVDVEPLDKEDDDEDSEAEDIDADVEDDLGLDADAEEKDLEDKNESLTEGTFDNFKNKVATAFGGGETYAVKDQNGKLVKFDSRDAAEKFYKNIQKWDYDEDRRIITLNNREERRLDKEYANELNDYDDTMPEDPNSKEGLFHNGISGDAREKAERDWNSFKANRPRRRSIEDESLNEDVPDVYKQLPNDEKAAYSNTQQYRANAQKAAGNPAPSAATEKNTSVNNTTNAQLSDAAIQRVQNATTTSGGAAQASKELAKQRQNMQVDTSFIDKNKANAASAAKKLDAKNNAVNQQNQYLKKNGNIGLSDEDKAQQKAATQARARQQMQNAITRKDLQKTDGTIDPHVAEVGNLKAGNLSVGSSGDRVTELQKTLKNAGYNIGVDGKFGKETEAALKKYQDSQGITPDGVYGTQTNAAIANTKLGITNPNATAKQEGYSGRYYSRINEADDFSEMNSIDFNKDESLQEGLTDMELSIDEPSKVSIHTEKYTNGDEMIAPLTTDDANALVDGQDDLSMDDEFLDGVETDDAMPEGGELDAEFGSDQGAQDMEQGMEDMPMDANSEMPTEDEFDEIPDDAEDGDQVDVDVDKLDKNAFESLSESYLRQTYDNVDSFKAESLTRKNGNVVCEGTITFTSGNNYKTQFIIEGNTITRDGKCTMLVENAQITPGKKAIKLNGHIENKKFIPESLNYSYKANNQLIKGTINK